MNESQTYLSDHIWKHHTLIYIANQNDFLSKIVRNVDIFWIEPVNKDIKERTHALQHTQRERQTDTQFCIIETPLNWYYWNAFGQLQFTLWNGIHSYVKWDANMNGINDTHTQAAQKICNSRNRVKIHKSEKERKT